MAATKYLSYAGLQYLWTLLKAKFNDKQDTISDLSTIRTNASTGAGLKDKVDGIATGAQVNVIETVKVNDAALTVTGKAVNVEVPTAATTAPVMDGTAAIGTSSNWAKADHVHPSDTSKVDVVAGKGLSENDFTDSLLEKLNGVEAGGQVNVIETVKVNNAALTVTDKTVSIANASTSGYGCTMLYNGVDSSSNALAATAGAVKSAYDLANGKQDPETTIAGYGITDAYTKTEIDGKMDAAMHYKGSVATVADLPASNNEVGDVYNVTATGENYAWAPAQGNSSAGWDILGNIWDLQSITSSEIDTITAD